MSAVSPVRMMVLGAVHSRGQAHGYQVRRDLLTWRADYWAKIAPGSVYQALRTLAKHRMLTEAGTEDGDGGPERTVYRITPDGETELLHLIRVSISDPDSGSHALNAGFALLGLLGREETANLFGYRIRALNGRHCGQVSDADAGISSAKPEQVDALVELYAAQTSAEIDWAHGMVGRVRGGAFGFADDPDDRLACTDLKPGNATNQA